MMDIVKRLRSTVAAARQYQALHGGWGVLEDAAEEIERLREEIVELLEKAFKEIAGYEGEGEREGWWDSMAGSTAAGYGDRLVELGTWERHPDGCGRQWWYRPVEPAGIETPGRE